MRFVENGPNIPDELLQKHEQGEVIFFCGAGISYPANLPGFKDLVDRIYDNLNETKNSEEENTFERNEYDRTIHLLERRIKDGRLEIRRAIHEILTPAKLPHDALNTHKSLLNLSRNDNGALRLITTNFDRLFEEASKRFNLPQHKIYRAPNLPIPKGTWDSLTYLHGLLPQRLLKHEDMLQNLVISSGDFGRAYLTDGWASRFISVVFSKYTICFVGYSVSDPVLRYVVDAIAADRDIGEILPEVYAFVGYNSDNREEEYRRWKSLNIKTIDYDCESLSNHSRLHTTLQKWSETFMERTEGKKRIVRNILTNTPMRLRENEDATDQLIWALSDPKGGPAREFANMDIADESQMLDILEIVSAPRFTAEQLSRFDTASTSIDQKFSLLIRPISRPKGYQYLDGPFFRIPDYTQLDPIHDALAYWLLKGLNYMSLFYFVLNKGANLHPSFAIRTKELIRQGYVNEPMKRMWTLLLDDRISQDNSMPSFKFHDWIKYDLAEEPTPLSKARFREALRPKVKIRGSHSYHHETSKIEQSLSRYLFDIVLHDDHLIDPSLDNNDISKRWKSMLPKLGMDLTLLLKEAIELQIYLGIADERHDLSKNDIRSLYEKSTSRGYCDWTFLVTSLCHAWHKAIKTSPSIARELIDCWSKEKSPIFVRLTLYALANGANWAPEFALRFLLKDRHWWLWANETNREVLVLLTSLPSYLTHKQFDRLQLAVLQGPARSQYAPDIPDEWVTESAEKAIWLRLARIKKAGIALSDEAESNLTEFKKKYKLRLAGKKSEDYPGLLKEHIEFKRFRQTPHELADLIDWLRKNKAKDRWDEDDDWQYRCINDPDTVLTALGDLAESGEWYPVWWEAALYAWEEAKMIPSIWPRIKDMLQASPDNFIREISHILSRHLEILVKMDPSPNDEIVLFCHRILDVQHDVQTEAAENPLNLTLNHPVGRIAYTAIKYMYGKKLENNMRIQQPERDLFTKLCDPSSQAFYLGRVVLSLNSIDLFRLDQEWTIEHLLPYLKWSNDFFGTSGVWMGFLWPQRLYEPMLPQIQDDFLETASHYDQLNDDDGRYSSLLAFAASEMIDRFDWKDVKTAVKNLPANGKAKLIAGLVKIVDSYGKSSPDYYRTKIKPFFKRIWPKENGDISEDISINLALLCISADESFMEAVNDTHRYMRPIKYAGRVFNRLMKTDLVDKYPKEMLALLDSIIKENYSKYEDNNLRYLLDQIVKVNHGLDADPRYIRLRKILW